MHFQENKLLSFLGSTLKEKKLPSGEANSFRKSNPHFGRTSLFTEAYRKSRMLFSFVESDGETQLCL